MSARKGVRNGAQRGGARRPKPIEPKDAGAARRRGDDPRAELRRVAGERAERVLRQLVEAGEAFAAERFQDSRRILQPLADRYPGAASVRELYGLTLYRMERWAKAAQELDAFLALTQARDQHPVLMDCRRAQGRYAEVEALWDDLRSVSPAGDLVTEGRIVMAGALADQGRLVDALRLLRRGPVDPKRAQSHHLRLWYALGDLEERAGNLPQARALFERVRRQDATFADVPQRLAALA